MGVTTRTCPGCGRTVSIRANGKICAHFRADIPEICPVSGEKLAEVGGKTTAPIKAEAFLLAMTQRTTLVELLDRHDVPWRYVPSETDGLPGAVELELGQEHWLACYGETGHLEKLVWR